MNDFNAFKLKANFISQAKASEVQISSEIALISSTGRQTKICRHRYLGHSVIETEHLLKIEIFCKFYDISYLKIEFSLQETNKNLRI